MRAISELMRGRRFTSAFFFFLTGFSIVCCSNKEEYQQMAPEQFMIEIETVGPTGKLTEELQLVRVDDEFRILGLRIRGHDVELASDKVVDGYIQTTKFGNIRFNYRFVGDTTKMTIVGFECTDEQKEKLLALQDISQDREAVDKASKRAPRTHYTTEGLDDAVKKYRDKKATNSR